MLPKSQRSNSSPAKHLNLLHVPPLALGRTTAASTQKSTLGEDVKLQDCRQSIISMPDRTSHTDGGKRKNPAPSNRSVAHSVARIAANRDAAVLPRVPLPVAS